MKLNCAIWCIFFNLLFLFHRLAWHQGQQGQALCVQHRLDPADESTWLCLTCCPALGVNSGWKIGQVSYFIIQTFGVCSKRLRDSVAQCSAEEPTKKNKQSVEKNLQRVKKTTFFFVKVHDFRVSNTSLSVYNADRIRLRSPLWPHLTSWPALGINPGWKIGYQSFIFQPFAALLELCSFSSFHRTRRHQDQPRPGSPCTTPAGSGRGVHSDHTWLADQPWESILDEKSGI